jgi:hypothetical protein
MHGLWGNLYTETDRREGAEAKVVTCRVAGHHARVLE